MINPTKPNNGLWISSEPSPESLQIVFKPSVYVNQTNFSVKLKTKLGGKQRASQKSEGDSGPPRPPLEPPLRVVNSLKTWKTSKGVFWYTSARLVLSRVLEASKMLTLLRTLGCLCLH